MNHIGTWQLIKHGIRTGDSNPAESFNCVIKRIIEWTEKPPDVAARAMALTFQYYDTELLRGRYGLGQYNIIPSLGKVSEETAQLQTTFIIHSNNSSLFHLFVFIEVRHHERQASLP